jgi:hypothetical protein
MSKCRVIINDLGVKAIRTLDFLGISIIFSQFHQIQATVVSKVRLLKPGRTLTAILGIGLVKWREIGWEGIRG